MTVDLDWLQDEEQAFSCRMAEDRLKIRAHIEETDQTFKDDCEDRRLVAAMENAVHWGLVLLNAYEDYQRRDRVIERLLTGERFLATVKGIAKLQVRLHQLRHPEKATRGTGRLSQDDIEKARAFPFEDLHPFTRGMALCPFHPDRTPSMSLKNNRAFCFSCGRGWDTIAFLQEKEGLSFKDAVRRLT